ncbi:hypothetical protein NMG60_11001587 [Bertholletia excelsa]
MKGKSARLDLKLSLSPPRANRQHESSSKLTLASQNSLPSMSVELDEKKLLLNLNRTKETPMILMGCPRCLMYILIKKEDPKCPKCNSKKLIDVHSTQRCK